MGHWINPDVVKLQPMAPHSNPDAPSSGHDLAPAGTPSADDLLALIPDMELLENSTLDALASQAAFAAGTGRAPGPPPKLTDPVPRAANPASRPVINDDPYADLMPELDSHTATVPIARSVPPVPTSAAPAPALPASGPTGVPTRPPPRTPTRTSTRPPVAAAPARTPPRQPVAPEPVTAPQTAAAAQARKLPDPQTVIVPPVMDREYIVRNRIVEMYLAGSLPVRGATVFERFCRENPSILDEIGLAERVHAGLGLLESGGKPEPWQEQPKKFWERPYVPLTLAAVVLVLGIGILWLNRQLSEQMHKVAVLHQLVLDQPLDAATATTSIDIQPTHAGPAAAIATTIGGAAAELVNLKVDMTHSDFRAFRITIDRRDQGRVAVLNNLVKDSNGELGFSLNTSALGAGIYLLTIEGLDWRGDPQPDSWAAITIRH